VPPWWWITFNPVKLLLAPKWLRRLVTVPAMLVVFVWLLGLLPLWLLVAAFVQPFANAHEQSSVGIPAFSSNPPFGTNEGH
jgi:hypothetical protein